MLEGLQPLFFYSISYSQCQKSSVKERLLLPLFLELHSQLPPFDSSSSFIKGAFTLGSKTITTYTILTETKLLSLNLT